MLCYDYAPLNTVGAHRINEWVANLYRYNIHPVVMTRKWNMPINQSKDYYQDEQGEVEYYDTEQYTVIRIPNRLTRVERLNAFLTKKSWILLRKVLSFFTMILRFAPGLNLEKDIYLKEFMKVHERYKPDIVLASGEPFVLFKYAYLYGKRFKVPYVLDYRDGWSTNVFRQNGLQAFFVRMEALFELKFLKSSKFAVIASELLRNELFNRFGEHPIEIVENGVDLELVKSVEAEPSSVFSIVYTGTIYPKHNVADFLKAFERLIGEDEEVSLRFVGISHYEGNANTKRIEQFQERYPKQVQVIPKVSKKESIALQKESTVLLKFSSGPVVKGFYGAKLYEYASVGKPILNVVKEKNHARTDFFYQEKIQTFGYDETSCYEALIELKRTFDSDTIRTEFLSEEQIESLSRAKQTRLLASLIRNNIQK